MEILSVAGARPNFIKIASLAVKIREHPRIHHILVHTGQHYTEFMSHFFFDDLNIPPPDINLEVGSATHAVQTAEIMKRFEPVLETYRPKLVIVVGDVNSTIACALVAKKMGIDVAHVEAGLRSFDRSMPEEINRILTDAIADLFFVTERSAEHNLLHEGIPSERIFFVGNVMIDTLLAHRVKAEESKIRDRLGFNSNSAKYGLVTLHRPSNVDHPAVLERLLVVLRGLSDRVPLVFPVHPRTRERVRIAGLEHHLKSDGLRVIDPLGYLDFLNLMAHASFVITDSGGIQEETTVLGVPCLTVRANTERPVTIEQGTNQLVGTNPTRIIEAAEAAMNLGYKSHSLPDFWDGRAAERIIRVLLDRYDCEAPEAYEESPPSSSTSV